jgi:ornithine--oxo-acid transaminase
MSQLEEIAKESKYIETVRGKGMMIGIQIKTDAPDAHQFAEKFFEEGMIIKESHQWVLRFTPPIVASKEDLDFALGLMRKIFLEDL